MTTHVLVPVRYSAWLAGDLGKELTRLMESELPRSKVTRLARGFLVEAEQDPTEPHETPGMLADNAIYAARQMETAVASEYPIFHKEMGPVWTRTVQVVVEDP